MAETRLWTWLRPYLPRGQYSRVESGDTAAGIPDVYYRIQPRSGWIELKDARSKNPAIPFPNKKVGLHQSQLDWISENVQYGGTVWIAARVDHLIFWVPGKYHRSFNGASLRRLEFISSLVLDQDNPGPSLKELHQLLKGAS